MTSRNGAMSRVSDPNIILADNFVALLGSKGGPSIRPASLMPTTNLFVLNGQMTVVDCALGVTRGPANGRGRLLSGPANGSGRGMRLRSCLKIAVRYISADHCNNAADFSIVAAVCFIRSMIASHSPAC